MALKLDFSAWRQDEDKDAVVRALDSKGAVIGCVPTHSMLAHYALRKFELQC